MKDIEGTTCSPYSFPLVHMLRLLETATHSVEIKKSKFIATCVPINSAEEAQMYIDELKRDDARHNCWAYRIGEVYRFSDDGEPAGSAGRPMLAAIDGMEFDGVLAHVVRYFGGIKLGVGGLVRAYGNTVKQALNQSVHEEIVEMSTLSFLVEFSDSYAIHGLIRQYQLEKLEETYEANGIVFQLSMQAVLEDEIRTALLDATQARIQWNESSENNDD